MSTSIVFVALYSLACAIEILSKQITKSFENQMKNRELVSRQGDREAHR
jgi:Na+-transporting methylmalonyl-CoA/oxaloacetate decarboxylase gamma subunit